MLETLRNGQWTLRVGDEDRYRKLRFAQGQVLESGQSIGTYSAGAASIRATIGNDIILYIRSPEAAGMPVIVTTLMTNSTPDKLESAMLVPEGG